MNINVSRLNHSFFTGKVETPILFDVSCKFDEREVTAIVGPSGSGKSTLLSLIGSLDSPTKGKIFFDSDDITIMDNKNLSLFRFNTIGFVFQQFHLLHSLTVRENILVALLNKKITFNKSERVDEIMNLIGLYDKKNSLPSQLSGGQQQRVAIARALINHPRWILADEPTGNLDSENGELIFNLLLNLHEQEGCGVIFVTHDIALAERADRIIFMQDGKIIEDRRNEAIC
ncbi:ABC transporter ATP-binding protein [Exiguobacterium artemiae]|uniref:ABC transporter ATP-binding protein n=1 Tax=Exiguobacterium artemiae TaxID=340145 RepID=UPI002963FE6D|nr:ABC transporter ATP-binding protein [Exiguobacterium sibiricum]MDW2886443.1 ABC transporter ATP-binding protein [Exiguobacterium sibiricum]